MAPKKKGAKGSKKKKSAKPAWMSDEMYALSQNLPKLQEFWCGEVKENKGGKGKDGKPLPEIPNISKEQAGRFMWQLLFPNNKAAKERREECIKLQVVETSISVMAKGKLEEVTPAMGILACLVDSLDQARQIFLDNKPSPLPHLLKHFVDESASLKATACSLLRVVATKDDSRPRLWRAMREWDWAPLMGCLQLQDRSQLGGRHAAHDAMTAMAALCGAPEFVVAEGACNAVKNSGGLKSMVELLSDRVSHPMTKAGVASVLYSVMRRNPGSLSQELVVGMGALKPLVNLFDHPVIPLLNKAHAAACMLRFIMPDKLWKDSSVLAPPKKAVKKKPATPAPAAAEADPQPLPAMADPAVTAAVALAAANEAAKAEDPKQAASSSAEPATPAVLEPIVPDVQLLDDETREDVLSRARLVAEMGAVKPLVLLCNNPEGPLPDLEAKAAAEAEAGENTAASEGGKKKKKKKPKKKKKGKLEPGMAEAQTFGSAVLRLISMDERWREPLLKAAAVRYMLPLMDAKLSPARWNARQLLINLSMSPELMPTLELYKVPAYVHGGNIPGAHYERPYVSAGDELEKLPAHLADSRAAAQAARAAGSSGKPPPLKNFGASTKPPALRVSGTGA